MLARFEIMPTFASAITKTVLRSLETNVAKGDTDVGSKRRLEKVFEKVLEKFGGSKYSTYLCTTFRSEKTVREFFKRFFDLLVIQRENVVFICQFL